MSDVIYTDAEWIERGVVPQCTLDLAYGADENDFALTVPIGFCIDDGALVYVDGTGWGGIVRGNCPSTIVDGPHGKPTNTIVGTTWQGVLAESYIVPDAGSHVEVSGDANDAMRAVVKRQGLDAMFDVEEAPSGFPVAHRFDRFADVYASFRKMLAQVGAKLVVAKDPGCKPKLSAVGIRRCIDDGEAARFAYRITDDTPVNHIIGLGKGEMEERIVVHRFADAEGRASAIQSIFPPHERQYLYELSSSDEAELIEACDEELKELQKVRECELRLPAGEAYEVGDVVGIVDENTGKSITAEVVKAIVRLDAGGRIEISNEIGDVIL
jgi:hypothetical protein